jgi:hypothetical protein
MRARAPFRVKSPEGRTQRDAALRRYLACFGIDSPPKSSSDRAAVSDSLIKTIAAISQGKPRPSLVHVLGSAPEATFMPQLSTVVGRLRRLGTVVSWALPLYEPGLTPPWVVRVPTDDEIEVGATEATALDPIAPHAADAVRVRALVAQKRSEQGLMRMGIRVGHVRPGFRVKAEREEAREEGAASEVAGAPPA